MNVAYAKNKSAALGVAGFDGLSVDNPATLLSNDNQVASSNQLGAVVGLRQKF
ncbi:MULTISPECIES: hypothetical protein [Burkholderia]|jgi:hypothetical protein|uniref:Porin n=1 Tax=Burkholderia contaminans TaxID=488447 RepID=A0A250LH92_9BURK|nr:hypothetical protein SK875_C01024 [Burkholderia contaminans]BBA43877.1 hypothetical protein BCCH1_63790 [Burkholderia contaminans]GLZ74638.1 hypothetical protein Bcon01_76830 [Burkholderia contaminans]VWB05714.1 hypothetical protein BCO23253_00066 [Burkholderia contaminans]VWD61563.1 hypothetical protein BCO37747_07398 [Burkholderia contaminans]